MPCQRELSLCIKRVTFSVRVFSLCRSKTDLLGVKGGYGTCYRKDSGRSLQSSLRESFEQARRRLVDHPNRTGRGLDELRRVVARVAAAFENLSERLRLALP